MQIIDFRLRPPFKNFLKTIMYAQPERRRRITRSLGFEPPEAAEKQSMELVIQDMEEVGVKQALVTGRNSGFFGSIGNAEISELMELYPGRFIGAACIEATDRRRDIQQIDQAIKAGFRAVNIEPGAYATPMYPDDRRLYPIYAHCEDHKIPVIVMAGGNAGPDISYTQPDHIDRVLADFPDLVVVVSHGGWPWVNQIIHIALRRTNLYLSPDMYMANLPGLSDYIQAADGFLADRFIYATSFPFCGIKEHAAWFQKLPIRPESMRKVMFENAVKVLRLA